MNQKMKDILRPKLKELRDMIFMLRRNALTMAAVIALILILILALLAPAIVPYPQDIADKTNLSEKFQPPSSAHLFGTDGAWTRCVQPRPVRNENLPQHGCACSSTIIDHWRAAWRSRRHIWRRGRRDNHAHHGYFPEFSADAPGNLACVHVGAKPEQCVLAIALAWWPWYTRIVARAGNLAERTQIIQAAETIGTPKWKIVAKHIIPNTISPVVVQASMDMGGVILTIASLSYLGLGAQAPSPEWGLMISTSRNYFPDIWWYSVFPGIAIFITVLAFNLLAMACVRSLSPKTRKKEEGIRELF